jgi:hypothetical protein
VKRLLRHGGSALALFGLAAAAHYPFCGLAFRCGCVATGMGAAAHCNVHASTGPHCPWCELPWLGTFGLVLTLVAQGLVYRAVFRRSASAATAAFAAALAFPLAALLAALLTWLATDYPHFFVEGARASLGAPAGPLRCVRPGP